MHLIQASSFYRRAKRKGLIEDGIVINLNANMFMVCDGVSGPYSLSNPVQKYGTLTGGQMASSVICGTVGDARSFDKMTDVLIGANGTVGKCHMMCGKDFSKEAVAGSCVSACQISDDHLDLVLIGDCFALCKASDGLHFYTNFDQAAFEFEQKADGYFRDCKEECHGDIGKAWDMYFTYFASKQFFRANRNLKEGGHAMLNGNPALPKCWTWVPLEASLQTEWILLGTDGLLPQTETDPRKCSELTKHLGRLYESGGIPAILDWRDSFPGQPHITGWPEASAIEIRLGHE